MESEGKILRNVQYTRANGELILAGERIVRETALVLMVDGSHFATAMILANMEEEYVLGFLYIQGIINSASDIVSVRIDNNVADVRLGKSIDKRVIPQQIISGLTVSREDVLSCVSDVLKSPLFRETESVHSAGLFLDGKEAVSITEDLGRHNALDKVVGAALLKNVDFGRILATSTGRQPTEMISKCRNAGIPIMATKGVPTSMGIELAEKTGITLVGMVRGDDMIVYSHPERIE